MKLKVRIAKHSGRIPQSCGAIGAGKLREVLTQTEIAEINNLDENKKEGKEEEKTKGFYKNITAITAFTKDLRIVRLHLLIPLFTYRKLRQNHFLRAEKGSEFEILRILTQFSQILLSGMIGKRGNLLMKFKVVKPVILASASPRRKEILSLLGFPFTVVPSNVSEDLEVENDDFEAMHGNSLR